MLTRLYIDNFRCFVNFEYRPARRQLIIGGNGSGKSSLQDALLRVRQLVLMGQRADELFGLGDRTRWLSQIHQTIEIEAVSGGHPFRYRLVLAPAGAPERMAVFEETLWAHDEMLL